MHKREVFAALLASGLAVTFVHTNVAQTLSEGSPSASHAHTAATQTDLPVAQSSTISLLPVGTSSHQGAQTFDIQVRSADGKPVEHFSRTHTKLMHLIVVSADLQHYQHLHPEYRGKGIFRVPVTFPATGRYTFFADYTPMGGKPQVAVQKLVVGSAGRSAPSIQPETRLRTSVGGVNVHLSPAAREIRPGVPVTLHFDLSDAGGRPLTDLEPYLGAMGHLVALQASPELRAEHYLHAHPVHAATNHGGEQTSSGDHSHSQPVAGRVSFHTVFPEPGTYKLWGEFQRGGRVFAVDFTLAIAD